MKAVLMLAAVAALCPALAAADALVCAGGIVEAGDPLATLVDKCGEPVRKTVEGNNWYYQVGGGTYLVRVSDSDSVAEIKQVFD